MAAGDKLPPAAVHNRLFPPLIDVFPAGFHVAAECVFQSCKRGAGSGTCALERESPAAGNNSNGGRKLKPPPLVYNAASGFYAAA